MTLPPAEHLQREPQPKPIWPIYVVLAIVVGTGLWQAWEMVR